MSELTILYADAALVVCIKPAGAASEGTDAAAMPQLLAAQLGCPVYPVHRLDQPVGGVMVYAKTQKAAAALCAQMAAEQFEKTYLAVLPAPMESAAGTLRDLLFYDRRRGKSFVVERPRAGVKEASLSYETLESGAAGCLVRVRLHTGRTHQIRVQFAARKHPLMGDGKYGSRVKCNVALWSHVLRFCHPADGRELRFSAPPPDAFPWGGFSAYSGYETKI